MKFEGGEKLGTNSEATIGSEDCEGTKRIRWGYLYTTSKTMYTSRGLRETRVMAGSGRLRHWIKPSALCRMVSREILFR